MVIGCWSELIGSVALFVQLLSDCYLIIQRRVDQKSPGEWDPDFFVVVWNEHPKSILGEWILDFFNGCFECITKPCKMVFLQVVALW